MSHEILERAYQHIDFDRELVFKFFISFSIFEKVLKENGFHQERGDSEDIQPDWRRFATTIDEQFTANKSLPDNQELRTAIDYLLSNPPEKQVFRGGRIQFINSGRSSDSDTEWLAVLIARVRNNLFHGAKFSYDRPRDTQLIQFSLIILEEWANLNSNVSRALQEMR
jgi:hypothetical protein